MVHLVTIFLFITLRKKGNSCTQFGIPWTSLNMPIDMFGNISGRHHTVDCFGLPFLRNACSFACIQSSRLENISETGLVFNRYVSFVM